MINVSSRPACTYAKSRPVRSCRHCLGDGCIHCNHRGQVRVLEFKPVDREALRLRAAIFGTVGGRK
jgi:hypothetical protein